MNTKMIVHPGSRSLSARLSRRTSRRKIVGGWVLCCVGFLALASFEVKGIVWFALIALTLAVDAALYVATHRITDRPTASLDEREQTVRNQAYRSAYLLVFYGIILAVGGAMLLLYSGNLLMPRWLAHPAAHPEVLTGFGVATLQIVSLLPTALIAWSEQDAPTEFD